MNPQQLQQPDCRRDAQHKAKRGLETTKARIGPIRGSLGVEVSGGYGYPRKELGSGGLWGRLKEADHGRWSPVDACLRSNF